MRILGLNQTQYFAGLGEAIRLVLRELTFAVNNNVEDAVVPSNQFRGDTRRFFDLGRQTGGLWKIVSTSAVGD